MLLLMLLLPACASRTPRADPLTGPVSLPDAPPAARAPAAAAPPAAKPSVQIEHCPVCVYDHNPVGSDVIVTRATPRVIYNGQTYYFNSAECRAAFLKQPLKYLNGLP